MTTVVDVDLATGIGGTVGVTLAITLGLLFLIPYVVIIRKAGWSGWWILVTFVPVVNLVMLLVFAFAEWPVHRDLKYARIAQAQARSMQTQSRFAWH